MGKNKQAASGSLFSSVLSNDASLDSAQQLIIRKLGKKATETKLKALTELRTAVSTEGAEWSASLLPQWTLAFGRLADDASWQVREQSCAVLNVLAQQLRRQLAPHLKLLIAPWVRCLSLIHI